MIITMEKRSLIFIYISILLIISAFSVAYATEDIEKIIFKERKIEGKIRRPQLVLIKAEKRPEFSSIIMQGVGSIFIITEFGT